MKIAPKLILSYCLVASLVIILGYTVLKTYGKTATRFDEIIQQFLPIINTVDNVRYYGLRIATHAKGFAPPHPELAASGRKSFNHDYSELEQLKSEAYEPFDKAIVKLRQVVSASSHHEYESFATSIESAAKDLKKTALELISLKENNIGGKEIVKVQNDFNRVEAIFLEVISDALEHEYVDMRSMQKEVTATIDRGSYTIKLVSVSAFILAVVMGVLFAGNLSSPIIALKKAALALGKGNLDTRVEISSGDELGILSDAFNRMAETLSESTVSKNYLENILASIADSVVILDPDNNIKWINRATEDMLSYKEHELKGMPPSEIIDDETFMIGLFEEMSNHGSLRDVETFYISKDKEKIPVSLSAARIKDSDQVALGTVFVAKNITKRKQAEEHLYFLANYDVLTGLPNRALLTERLGQTLSRISWSNRVVGLLLCDLDRFKVINDALGHSAGDSLLKIAAERLSACVREGDTVARLGGDEFAVLLNDMASPDHIAKVAQKIIDSLSEPIELEGRDIYVTVSIGISISSTEGTDPDNLIRYADIAMYRAKDHGKNIYQIYSPLMNARAYENMEMETALRKASDRGEFEVWYQPKFDLKNSLIVGAESLVRWRHPEKGMISPNDFLPLASETGIIALIDEWVLRVASLQNKAWQDAGYHPITISVNLSDGIFKRNDLLEIVANILKETEIQNGTLELELTENIMMKNVDQSRIIMEKLRAMGVQLSIDDFGTGHSSLAHLKRFPIHTLKIDRSFISDIVSNPDDAAIVEAIIAMAKILNLNVVAEGVETLEQQNFLARSDCNQVQGYFISKPVPAAEFETILKKQNQQWKETV